MHVVTRVYNDGSRHQTKPLRAEDAIRVMKYNMLYRPGCAVFMDDVCVARGYLDWDRVSAIADELTQSMEEKKPEIHYDPEVNQCDGCRQGLPLVGSLHYREERAWIGCTAERYGKFERTRR